MMKKKKITKAIIYYSKIVVNNIVLYIASLDEGLVSIGIDQEEDDFIRDIKKDFPMHQLIYDKEKNTIYINQLYEYFEGKRTEFTIPLYMVGTDFQKKVWNALLDIPYGQTITYKDLAYSIDNPKAVRAVGGANNKNRIPIIIPCHRVIGANKKLVGYGGGLHIKEKLLNIEGIKVEGEKVVE